MNEFFGFLDERLLFGIFIGDVVFIGWVIYEVVENFDSVVFVILGFLFGGLFSWKFFSDVV